MEARPRLTKRESEIHGVLKTGATNKEIAAACFITAHTVANHLRAIYQKLKVRNRTEAANIKIKTP